MIKRTRIPMSLLTIVLVLLLNVPTRSGRKHEDVENIGNRDINGKVALIFPNFISLEKEIQIGAQYAQQIEQTARLVEDPVVNEYVDGLGQLIVKNSDAKVPFVIRVLDSEEVNAFALPGGYFFVNKGLILEAEDEAELAGVMAHEIAHVTARHATERMTKGNLMQFAALPALILTGGWTQYALYQGLGLGMNLAVLGITRKSEAEADQLGTQYLWNTGYDPQGFISFFEKMQAKNKSRPGKFASFFRTHPSFENRIAKVNEEITYLPPKDEYVVSTSEFDRVKARLIQMDRAEIRPGQGGTKSGAARPTLKRRTNDRDDREEPTLKGDRPTLKRPSLKRQRPSESESEPESEN